MVSPPGSPENTPQQQPPEAPRARWMRTFTLKESVDYFRDTVMEPTENVGIFLGRYGTLWHYTHHGEVDDYEASYRLVEKLPLSWRTWANAQIRETTYRDRTTRRRISDFPALATRIFTHWIHELPMPPPPAAAEQSPRDISMDVQTNIPGATPTVPLVIPCSPPRSLFCRRTRFEFEVGSSSAQAAQNDDDHVVPQLPIIPDEPLHRRPRIIETARKWREDRSSYDDIDQPVGLPRSSPLERGLRQERFSSTEREGDSSSRLVWSPIGDDEEDPEEDPDEF